MLETLEYDRLDSIDPKEKNRIQNEINDTYRSNNDINLDENINLSTVTVEEVLQLDKRLKSLLEDLDFDDDILKISDLSAIIF